MNSNSKPDYEALSPKPVYERRSRTGNYGFWDGHELMISDLCEQHILQCSSYHRRVKRRSRQRIQRLQRGPSGGDSSFPWYKPYYSEQSLVDVSAA